MHRKNPVFFILIILFLIPIVLEANTETILDTLYANELAPMKESVWLILAGADLISEESNLDEVTPYLSEKGWGGSVYLRQGQLAVLLMDNFDLPRGIMYRLTGMPRYALKDLVYYGLINGGSNTEQIVSSFDLINSLNSVLEENRS